MSDTRLALAFALGLVLGGCMMAATWAHWDATHTTDCIEAR